MQKKWRNNAIKSPLPFVGESPIINVLPCTLIFSLSLSLCLLLVFSPLLTFPSTICLGVSLVMMFEMGAILAGSE